MAAGAQTYCPGRTADGDPSYRAVPRQPGPPERDIRGPRSPARERDRAAKDRDRAAQDRARAAQDRDRAARDRDRAAEDQHPAAEGRDPQERNRSDRDAGAGDGPGAVRGEPRAAEQAGERCRLREAERARRGRQDQTSLPWWALALPTLAFALLLALLAGGGDAHAAQGRGPVERPVVRVLERIEAVLLG